MHAIKTCHHPPPRKLALKLGLSATLLAGLVFPVGGQATVTIGSDLARGPGVGIDCQVPVPGCTFALAALPSAAQAPSGVVSPVNGTVTAWRIRTGGSVTPIAFRVIRPLGGGSSLGAGTGPGVTPPVSSTTRYGVQLPIQIGDLIGIDCCDQAFVPGRYFSNVPSPDGLLGWSPRLPGGPPGSAQSSSQDLELMINADIEPSSAIEVAQVKTLRKGRLRVTVTLPNPGTLIAGDKRDKKTGASAAAKQGKKKLLKRKTIEAGAPGEMTLTLKSTKTARKRLERKVARTGKRKAKMKAKLRLAFTPTGGLPAFEAKKATLRK